MNKNFRNFLFYLKHRKKTTNELNLEKKILKTFLIKFFEHFLKSIFKDEDFLREDEEPNEESTPFEYYNHLKCGRLRAVCRRR